MLNNRLTDRASKALKFAENEAERLNHDFVGPEHILLGLLREGSGIAYRVLDSMGISLVTARTEIEKLSAAGPNVQVAGSLPMNQQTKDMMVRAIEEAKAMGHDYIGTEHLLLGILRLEGSIALMALSRLGANLKAIKPAIIEWLGNVQLPTSAHVPPARRRQVRHKVR